MTSLESTTPSDRNRKLAGNFMGTAGEQSIERWQGSNYVIFLHILQGDARVKIQVRDFDGSFENWDLVENKTIDVKTTVNGWWAELDWKKRDSTANTKQVIIPLSLKPCRQDFNGTDFDNHRNKINYTIFFSKINIS